MYQTGEEGHHLKIELFHNGFVRKKKKGIKKFNIKEKRVRENDYHPSWDDNSVDEDDYE